MNKKFTLFLIIISIGVLYVLNIDKIIQNKLSSLNASFQSSYINAFININNVIEKYFNQLSYINQLKTSNESHLFYKTLYDIKANELRESQENARLVRNYEPKLELSQVKVLSYYQLYDNSRVILDKKNLQNSKIYALITLDGFSAGIVLNKNDASIGYLNQNEKCNYTVFIGEENAPGITSGVDDAGNLIVKYVPIWKKLTIGDEVITSSMDAIFPFGIKVGTVISIDIQDNIQELLIKPYATTLGNRDYLLYENQNKTIVTTNN